MEFNAVNENSPVFWQGDTEKKFKIETQYGVPCAWYQADVHENDANIQREFYLIPIGTGHDWGDRLHKDEYLGTALLYNDTLVLHYFLTEIENQKIS